MARQLVLHHLRTMDPHPHLQMMMGIILHIQKVAKKMVKIVPVRRIQMKTDN